jgi:ABC-type glycerol-3-phosphate transport system substrate-binding protein
MIRPHRLSRACVGAGMFSIIALGISVAGCPRAREASSAKPVITFWSTEGYQPEEVTVLQALAREFSERDGTAVKIEFFTWEEINSKYLAALAAGTPPNIGQHGPDLPLRFGQDGAVLPVDDLVGELGRERFFPEFLDAVCRYQEHYWSVPWFIEVRSLLIRTDWLAELNLEPPTTWDEWVRVCAAMTRDHDGDGAIDRWGFGMYGNDHFGQSWIPFAAQNGGGLFAADGSITVAAPENVAALAWYGDLYRKHRVTPPGTKSATWIDANLYYKRGLVGSLITNAYLLKELRADAPEVLAASRFYPIPVPRAGVQSRSYLGGSHLMVFRDAPHVDAARRFVRFLLDRNNYLRFLKSVEGGALPVFRDVASDPFFSDDPNLSVLIDQIAGAVRHPHRGPPNPAVGAAEGERIFGRALREVLAGTKSAEAALRDAQQATEAIFARHGAATVKPGQKPPAESEED